MESISEQVDRLANDASNGPTAAILKQLRAAKAKVLSLENRHIRQISKVRRVMPRLGVAVAQCRCWPLIVCSFTPQVLQDVLDTPVDLDMAYLSRIGSDDEVAAAASLADLSAFIAPMGSSGMPRLALDSVSPVLRVVFRMSTVTPPDPRRELRAGPCGGGAAAGGVPHGGGLAACESQARAAQPGGRREVRGLV